MMAAALPQDDRNHENRQSENNRRYYDKRHKDYHNWDSNEDRSYQRYQTEHHQRRAFVHLNSRQQSVYWSWRHDNPDNRQRIALCIWVTSRCGWKFTGRISNKSH